MNDFIPTIPTKRNEDTPQSQTTTTLIVDGVPSELAYQILLNSGFSLTPKELQEKVEGYSLSKENLRKVIENFSLTREKMHESLHGLSKPSLERDMREPLNKLYRYDPTKEELVEDTHRVNFDSFYHSFFDYYERNKEEESNEYPERKM